MGTAWDIAHAVLYLCSDEAAYLTAEMRDTKRGIERALIIGILIITVLYLLLNYAYLNALGLAGMRESKAVATDLMRVTWGSSGALVLGAAVVTAALSTLNATIFTGARTNYALSGDWASLRIIGERVQLTRRMLDRAVQRRQHHVVQLLETRLAELADEEVLLRRTLDGPVSAIPAGLDRPVDDETR